MKNVRRANGLAAGLRSPGPSPKRDLAGQAAPQRLGHSEEHPSSPRPWARWGPNERA